MNNSRRQNDIVGSVNRGDDSITTSIDSKSNSKSNSNSRSHCNDDNVGHEPLITNDSNTDGTTTSSSSSRRLFVGEQQHEQSSSQQPNNSVALLSVDASTTNEDLKAVVVSLQQQQQQERVNNRVNDNNNNNSHNEESVTEVRNDRNDQVEQERIPAAVRPRVEVLEENDVPEENADIILVPPLAAVVAAAAVVVVVSDQDERDTEIESQEAATIACITSTNVEPTERDIRNHSSSEKSQQQQSVSRHLSVMGGSNDDNHHQENPDFTEQPAYTHYQNDQGNTPLLSHGGGEMLYHYPTPHDIAGPQSLPPPPWMAVPQHAIHPHPFHYHQQQQQQQIDHAVAYANAAAHVAWAAAQAVQQAVLQQQQQRQHTALVTPYNPSSQTPLLIGAAPPLLVPPNGWTPPPQLSPPMGWTQPPPPWFGHNFPPPTTPPPPPPLPLPYLMTSHQAPIAQDYYNGHFVPSPYQLHSSQAAPYFDEHDGVKRQPDGSQSGAFVSQTDISEQTTYHSEEVNGNNDRDIGRHGGWYPRKRQQRLSLNESHTKKQQHVAPPLPVRDKIRRRLRSSDNESSSSGGYHHHHHAKQNWNDGVNKGPYQDKANYQNGSGRGHNSNSMNKKARSTNNEALIGKTGVAALFEWCSKRHCTPTFTIQKLVQSPPATVLDDEFECIVYLEQSLAIVSVRNETAPILKEQRTRVDDLNCEDGFLHEWGRGHGRNKNAAKQDSARRAMQALIPGIQFDEETGILIALPSVTTRIDAASNGPASNNAIVLDDLAPNLAKKLDISRDGLPNRKSSSSNSDTTNKKELAPQSKRTFGTYPETSTTSEDEDRSNYYASRGASVCSMLLHTIIQLDKTRIPDMPSFTYEISPTVPAVKSSPSSELDSKMDKSLKCSGESTPSSQQRVARCLRGSFKCIAKLKIVSTDTEHIVDGNGVEETAVREIVDMNLITLVESTIEAVGMGGTKRDARHVATAKLLSLLFPECKNDMAKVKAAAELMRDQYAASRVQKNNQNVSTRNHRLRSGEKFDGQVEAASDHSSSVTVPVANLSFALSREGDPPIPHCMHAFLAELCSHPEFPEEEPIDTNTCEPGESDWRSQAIAGNCGCDGDLSSAYVFRQLGRQKQMDYIIDTALHRFNELDDEGRIVCGGGSEDDVGRTILRRAEPSDIPRIKKLMRNNKRENWPYESKSRDNCINRNSVDTQKRSSKHQVSESELSSTLADVTITCEGSRHQSSRSTGRKSGTVALSQLWSSTSSTVLLLCRAIAAYEDPPLGCAYLNFDFTMAKGKELRVIEIGSESHLPQERFLDCLQSFATCINLEFERSSRSADGIQNGQLHYTAKDLMDIVASYAKRQRDDDKTNVVDSSDVADDPETSPNEKRFQSLHPVQEETEGSDDDDSKSSGSQTTNLPQLTSKLLGLVKPSKRSRFQ